MADEEKKVGSIKRITEKERFSYIGFEVHPGKPKDLFKSDAEKEKLIKSVLEKRAKGEIIREACTLTGERVSFGDRIVMTITCVIIIAALFLPWYSAYNEIIEEVTPVTSNVESTQAVLGDSLVDSLAIAGVEDAVAQDGASTEVIEGDTAVTDAIEGETIAGEIDPISNEGTSEEILHSYVAKKKINREYDQLTGIGSIVSLGSVGGMVFSSGFILMLSAALLLVYTILCIGLPAYTMFGLYGGKGTDDEKALFLKKIVKLNWIPVLIFVAALSLSFIGAEYSFDAVSVYQSIGSSYGPGAFLGTLSWGVFVSMAGFVLVAVKGVEI